MDHCPIFFLGNVHIDLLVFLEIFHGNEGVNMVLYLMFSLHFANPYHQSYFLETMAPSIHCDSFSYLNNLTFFISTLLVEQVSCTNLKHFIESPSSSSPLNLGIAISSNLGSNQTPQITTLISYKL
jgi:hypothetical protein